MVILEGLGVDSGALERSHIEHEPALARAWGEGEALEIDQALALALGAQADRGLQPNG